MPEHRRFAPRSGLHDLLDLESGLNVQSAKNDLPISVRYTGGFLNGQSLFSIRFIGNDTESKLEENRRYKEPHVVNAFGFRTSGIVLLVT